MNELSEIKKVCGFYVSSIHLITMILPYIRKQLDLEIEFSSFLEFNLQESVELVLSKLTSVDESKVRVLDINWNITNVYKYAIVEKELKNKLQDTKELNILVTGNDKYISAANENLDKFFVKNTKKIQRKCIKIINCYEVTQFNDNIKDILDVHDLMINTSGLHKIEEIFEGY